MNLAIVAAVFPIIFIGELPDKTMFAALVMSTHGKPWSVWLGAARAFVVHVTIATTVGVALFRLLPHRALGGPDANPDRQPCRPLPLAALGWDGGRIGSVAVSALAVIGGQDLLRFVNIRTVRFVTAAFLVLLAGVVGFPGPEVITKRTWAAWLPDAGRPDARRCPAPAQWHRLSYSVTAKPLVAASRERIQSDSPSAGMGLA